MSKNNVSRKDFMNLVWGAAGALAVTELSLAGLRFLAPRTTEGEFGGIFNLGGTCDFTERDEWGVENHPKLGGKLLPPRVSNDLKCYYRSSAC